MNPKPELDSEKASNSPQQIHPQHISITDYAYPLPDERIAKYPLAQRDQSKLLLYRGGDIHHTRFDNLPEYIPAGSLLIRNNTKVIQARLHFRKTTGALIEIFCLEPAAPADYQLNFQSRGHVAWLCMIGNLKKWKQDELEQEITVGDKTFTVKATRGERVGTSHWIDFTWDAPEISWAEILEVYGELPIPPYLNRDTEESDKDTYQTVYSSIKGSVAAPTAGLHFTPSVFEALQQSDTEINEVTLHVGAGTFRPVKAAAIGDHDMHTEYISVTRHTIERLIAHHGQAIAVGTTSVRTLESLYFMGMQVSSCDYTQAAEQSTHLHVSQWEPYNVQQMAKQLGEDLPGAVAMLQALLDYMDKHQMDILNGSTQIIIAPGYEYHIVKGIITNFHQPKSTLLLLVSAFVGEDWKEIYNYALTHDFRFLSYGDSSLLMP